MRQTVLSLLSYVRQSGAIFPIAFKVITNEKTQVFCDTNIFVTAKTKGVNAEREIEKRISTQNSSSYATMHEEKISKTGQNRPKLAILDKVMNISRNFVCTNNSRKSPAHMNEMKRLPWSILKSQTRLLRINWNKTTFQMNI